jgi:SseB protein N-terminal domain
MSETLNELEVAFAEARAGRMTMDAFLGQLAAAKIIVPTATEIQPDGSGFSPLIHPRAGTDMVVAFTHPHRINAALHAQAPYQLDVAADWLIRSLAPELGLILFAGPDHGLSLTPAQLAGMRKES